MPSAVPPAAGRPSRRTLLRTLGAGGSLLTVAGLAGCGLRLEHVAAPPAPARALAPDEAALLRVLTVTSFLAPLAARVRPASTPVTRLATLHREQASVVRDRLRTAGVPDALTAATPPSPSGSSGPATPATATAASTPTTQPVSAAVLTGAQTTALTSDLLVVLPGLTLANRPLVAAIAACTAAGTAELGRPVAWPAAAALPAAAASTLLDSSRAVVYGLEVAAARLDGDERAAVVETLTTVRRRVAGLVTSAGSAARPEPLGYTLPFPVVGAGAVRRLVEHLVSGLVASGLDPLAAGTVATGSTAVTTVVRLQAEAVGIARSWGVAPSAFPGMAAA